MNTIPHPHGAVYDAHHWVCVADYPATCSCGKGITPGEICHVYEKSSAEPILCRDCATARPNLPAINPNEIAQSLSDVIPRLT